MGREVFRFHFIHPSFHLSIPLSVVRSLYFLPLEGSSSKLVQIFDKRRHVMCNSFWPWHISSRSSAHDLAKMGQWSHHKWQLWGSRGYSQNAGVQISLVNDTTNSDLFQWSVDVLFLSQNDSFIIPPPTPTPWTDSFIIPPPNPTPWTKLKGGILVSPCPSVHPPVCPSVDRIVSALYFQPYSLDHFKLTHLIKQLQEVCHVYIYIFFQN